MGIPREEKRPTDCSAQSTKWKDSKFRVRREKLAIRPETTLLSPSAWLDDLTVAGDRAVAARTDFPHRGDRVCRDAGRGLSSPRFRRSLLVWGPIQGGATGRCGGSAPWPSGEWSLLSAAAGPSDCERRGVEPAAVAATSGRASRGGRSSTRCSPHPRFPRRPLELSRMHQ